MNPDNQQKSAPMTSPIMSSASTHDSQKKTGPVIAILAIVLILILAALYLFASRATPTTVPDTSSLSQNDQSGASSVLPVTGSSDDINSLQSDLNASTNGLDNQNF